MDKALISAAEELLAQQTLAVDDLLSELRRLGHDLDAGDPDDRDDFILEMTERGYWHFGDHLTLPGPLLRSRMFTHVVTADEAAGGYLAVNPDLAPLTLDEARTFEAGDTNFYDDFEPETGSVLRAHDERLPWPAGTTIAVRWIDDGRLSISSSHDAPEPATSLVTACSDAAVRMSGGGGSTMLLNLVGTLLAEDHHAFTTPQAPIGGLLLAAGYERRGEEVAPVGFDWGALAERRKSDSVAVTAREYGLDQDQAERFQRIQSAIYRAAPSPRDTTRNDSDIPRAVNEILDALGTDRRLNGLFLAWFNGLSARLPEFLDRSVFVEAAIATGRRLPPAVHMLRGVLAEEAGDATGHDAAVREALRVDPEFAAAIEDAQWIAAERGDASRALTLLHQLGASAPREEVETLGWYASPGPMSAGRNDPCPCGSGRKHKQCCARHNGHALDDRFSWRLVRAAMFVQRPAQRHHLLDFVRDVFAAAGADDHGHDDEISPSVLFVGTQHPTMVWLYLAEGGGLERYAVERGPLFSDDERELVRSWLPVRHRLLRFDETSDDDLPKDLDALVPVVDLVTGERIDVPTLYGPDRPRNGETAIMLVLSDGTRPRLAGMPIEVRSDQVDEVAAILSADSPDAVGLARLLVRDQLLELAGGIEERYGDLDLDDLDELDATIEVAEEDYLDRLELVLALLDDVDGVVDETKIIGRDPWEADEPLSDDDLYALIAAAHPEYESEIETGAEVEIAGETMSPRLHVAMHTIAARQILDDTPPEAYATALRLLDDGFELHDVMHMLSRVVSDHAYAAIKDGTAPDPDAYAAALDALPVDWEHERQRIDARLRAQSRRREHHPRRRS
ncbi:MAG TPA: SEC-C domain-containing protein [Acidimicrobiales bacterium]|nr:SEC-C domain-containing protein [Acidimicrobiales bacterium]